MIAFAVLCPPRMKTSIPILKLKVSRFIASVADVAVTLLKCYYKEETMLFLPDLSQLIYLSLLINSDSVANWRSKLIGRETEIQQHIIISLNNIKGVSVFHNLIRFRSKMDNASGSGCKTWQWDIPHSLIILCFLLYIPFPLPYFNSY